LAIPSVDLLIEDLQAGLAEPPYEIVSVANAWMLRTCASFAAVIRAAADVAGQDLDLCEFDVAVLAAWPIINRLRVMDIFRKEISRDLIGRLHAWDLIATGPRCPRRGAPYTFVTTGSSSWRLICKVYATCWLGNSWRTLGGGAIDD
jgi:segregation and condensation protein B